MAKASKAKVTWAFDPFSGPVKDPQPWADFLENLAKLEKSQIEPVYVLSPDGLNWSGEFSGPWVKKYRPLAETAAATTLAPFQYRSVTPARILVNPKVSLKGDVQKLAKDAKKNKRGMILVQTHARTGMERWMMGSFAESLLIHSKVPVLCVNPQTAPPKQIRRVLFPTDLSPASKRTFKKIIARCRAWGAEVVLAHKLPDPIEPIVQSGVYMAGGGWITLSQYFEKESAERRKKLDQWIQEAKAAGVSATVQVIEKSGLISDEILKTAKANQADMIALCSQSGPVSSVLAGSVARQIVRGAHCPVLVFHDDAKN